MVVIEEKMKLLIYVICLFEYFILYRKVFYDRYFDVDKMVSVIKKYGVFFGYILGY